MRFVLSLSLALLPLLVFAETSTKYTENEVFSYNMSGGLQNNQVMRLVEDQYGFIWIATTEGVSKFDGAKFVNFTMNSNETGNALSHFFSQDICTSPQGDVWIATPDGLNIYDYSGDSVRVIKEQAGSNGALPSNDITCFARSKYNRMYVGLYWHGVCYYDFDTKSYTTMDLPPTKEGMLPRYLFCMIEDSRMNLWFGTKNGLFYFNRSANRTEYYEMPRVSQIFEDSKGNVWIASDRLYLYTPKNRQCRPIPLSSESEPYRISALAEDKEGNLWIGTDLFLAYTPIEKLISGQRNILTYVSKKGNDYGQMYRSVSSIIFDRNDNLWIGTYGNGLYMIESREVRFKMLAYNRFDANTPSDRKITDVVADRAKNIYLCPYGSGVDKYNDNLKKVAHYNFNSSNPQGLSDNTIMCAYCDSSGNVWFGTYNSGVDMLVANSSIFKHYRSTSNNYQSLCSNEIRYIYQSDDGVMWFGTPNGLTSLYDGLFDNTFNQVSKETFEIRCITQLSENRLLIGTYGAGVFIYNYRAKSIEHRFLHDMDRTHTIINDINLTDSLILVATQGAGLTAFGRFTLKHKNTYNTDNGLLNNYVAAIQTDGRGDIWLSTSKNISKIDIQSGLVINYDIKDGVQNNGFSRGHTVIGSGDNMQILFAGNDGVNIFNPNHLPVNKKSSPILFTSFKLFNQVIKPGSNVSGGNPLTKNIIATDQIVLKPHQSIFSVDFIGLDYSNKSSGRYWYMLQGADKTWNYLGNSTEVTFRNLPSGDYVLKVKMGGGDGGEQEYISTLKIKVLPIFWCTPLAFIIYLVLAMGVLYFAWYISTMKMRTQNKLNMEKAERVREEEIHQAKLQFFTNISHDLRTPLTLIVYPLQDLVDSELPEATKSQLQLVLRNANKLLTMVNQLLDFRKTERSKMKLQVAYEYLDPVVGAVIDSFGTMKESRHIDISFSSVTGGIRGYFDSKFIDMILINLISNSFKFTEDYGQIWINLNSVIIDDKPWAKIEVCDTGCGIDEKDFKSIFDRFYQGDSGRDVSKWQGTGIGLHIVNNLITLHKGTICVDSVIGEGTKFTISLPMDFSAYCEAEFAQTEIYDQPELEQPQTEGNVEDKPRILIVEDDADMCHYLGQILNKSYNISVTHNGEEALNFIKNNDVDIIVSDIMMPKMDGITLCRTIKNNLETSHIPFILLTAKVLIEDRIEGLEVGADSYIPKPFKQRHLTVRIEKLLEYRNNLKELYSKTINFESQHKSEISPEEAFLQKIINFVRTSLDNSQLNGDDIGQFVGMSRMSLHRKMKSLTRMSTGEFIKNIRLNEAALLIENSNKNVSEICYDVGFSSPAYFTTCFTSHFKVPPTEYMKIKRSTVIK